jgi:hypothetical protein
MNHIQFFVCIRPPRFIDFLHAFAERFASAAISETCAEAGIDVDIVAAPALRAAPHQEGATHHRRHASK